VPDQKKIDEFFSEKTLPPTESMTSLEQSGGANFFKDQYANQITRLSNPKGTEEYKDEDLDLLDSGDLNLASLKSPKKKLLEKQPESQTQPLA
jgi:hypothetical protein